MANPVSSMIFAYRNADKTRNGDIGRASVCAGQMTNLFNEVAKYDNIIGAGAKSASSVFKEMSAKNKAFEYAGKGLKFASEHVNPLICASAALKVGMAEDKTKTAIIETSALSGMFLGEGLMKLHMDKVINEKNIEKLASKSIEKGFLKTLGEKIITSKSSGKIATFVKGITFVCGSIASYAIGEKFGDGFADRITANLGVRKIDQKA